MTPIMTAPKMTEGQIENAVNKLRDAMRKHCSEITSDVAQQVLGVENLGMMMFAVFRKHVEALSNLIVRRVSVNRTRQPQEVLDATGRKQCSTRWVVKSMSRGIREEVEVVFFTLGCYVSDDELEREYERRGLRPADPYSLAAVNEADPAFADDKPNVTHWQDADGRWCFVAFYRSSEGRIVVVDISRNHLQWHNCNWFAGLRKSA